MQHTSTLWRVSLRIASSLPAFIQTNLLRAIALGWFGLELVLARMVHPLRTIRCFQILWLFIQAQHRSAALLNSLLIGDPMRIKMLRRYARNCIVLVALQPEMAVINIRSEETWVRVAALFGACIPLYDGFLDNLITRNARQMTRAIDEMLQQLLVTADGHLMLLENTLGDHGAPADDVICWQRLIAELGNWLQNQSVQKRHLVLTMMKRMNRAQYASLAERDITTSIQNRRRLSSLKGGVSFLLLRSMCLLSRSDTSLCNEMQLAALIEAASVAQWIDDYADLREDLKQGIHTYISDLDQRGKACVTIRQGIQKASRSLRSMYGHRAEHFIDSLSLYFAVKRTHRILEFLEHEMRSNASRSTIDPMLDLP